MKVITLASVTALAFALGACASDPNSSRSASSGQTSGSASSEIKRDTKDSMLTGKVKAALAADVGLKTVKIDVDSEDGVVTLKGRVDSEDTRRRAEATAKKVSGVSQVRNQLHAKD